MCLVARQILPTAAEIKATIRNVIAAKNQSPLVRNQTRMAASAAIGKANKKPSTAIMIKPIITSTRTQIRSWVGSVGGTSICRAVKKVKIFTSLPKGSLGGYLMASCRHLLQQATALLVEAVSVAFVVWQAALVILTH